MNLSSFDGGFHGEHNSVRLVEISEIFVMHDECFLGTEPFGRLFIELYLNSGQTIKIFTVGSNQSTASSSTTLFTETSMLCQM